MARINDLSMSVLDVMVEMAEGNPGAVTVMMLIMDNSKRVDPDNIMGGLGVILSLDTHEIYGPRIWMLYKDVAGQDIGITLGLLRAVQLGFLSERKLNTAINDNGEGLDIPNLIEQVQAQLPAFQVN